MEDRRLRLSNLRQRQAGRLSSTGTRSQGDDRRDGGADDAGAARAGEQVARHRLDHLRHIDGGDRRVDRQRRRAPSHRIARRDDRADHLGDHRLRDRYGHGHAADWFSGATVRTEARVHGMSGVVRGRFRALRHGTHAAAARGLPGDPGPRRGRIAADRAGHPATDVSAAGAGDGDGRLRHGRRARTGVRSDPRRLHRRQLLLAVDLLHQRSGRRDLAADGVALRARAGGRAGGDAHHGRAPAQEHGLVRHRHADRRPRHDAVRARGRKSQRLVLIE